MTNTTAAVPPASAPLNLFARFIGIITAPRATYERVVAHPKWFGMLALTVILMAGFAALPMTTEAGRQAAIDQQITSLESWGMTVNDEMYAGIQQGAGRVPYTTAAGVLFMAPLMHLIMAGIFFAIFNAAMGGEATFKRVFTVVVHAGVISALGQMFTGPINYFRGAVTSTTSLGALLPMLDEKSFMGRLAGTIDIFVIWWVIVLSIGLAVLYRRKTQPIAISLSAAYAVIALSIAAFMSR